MSQNASRASDSSDVRGPGPVFEDLRSAVHDRVGQGRGPVVVARAPGRVNLIGGHTDYNDGFVLPTTIDRGVYVGLRRRSDTRVRLHSVHFEDDVTYPLEDPPVSRLPGWAQYVAGVAEELKNGAVLDSGFEGVVYGTVPLGAGLSSSAALEVAASEGLKSLFHVELGPIETARLCQTVEHSYVGVQCGIMDQMAVRLGRAGHALSLDCRTLDVEHVPLPFEKTSVLIADSRVSRELAGSKYNERRSECEEGVAFFQQFDSTIEALRDVELALFRAHEEGLSDPARRRCRHVITENRRVKKSAKALRSGNLEAFGELMSTSHVSLRRDFEVSIPELDLLVQTAEQTEGVYGARMTGAGFGGCVVCLARNSSVPALQRRLTETYAREFDRKPELYTIDRNWEVAVDRS